MKIEFRRFNRSEVAAYLCIAPEIKITERLYQDYSNEKPNSILSDKKSYSSYLKNLDFPAKEEFPAKDFFSPKPVEPITLAVLSEREGYVLAYSFGEDPLTPHYFRSPSKVLGMGNHNLVELIREAQKFGAAQPTVALAGVELPVLVNISLPWMVYQGQDEVADEFNVHVTLNARTEMDPPQLSFQDPTIPSALDIYKSPLEDFKIFLQPIDPKGKK